MAPNERSPGSPTEYPGELTAEQVRRFQLWRAMTELAKAQADGQLTAEQTRLLESLADNLQQLAGQLRQIAELGQQCITLLDTGLVHQDPLPGGPPES
jgi:hypothetical protein